MRVPLANPLFVEAALAPLRFALAFIAVAELPLAVALVEPFAGLAFTSCAAEASVFAFALAPDGLAAVLAPAAVWLEVWPDADV